MIGAGSATIKLDDSRTHNDKSLWNSTAFGIAFLDAAIIEMQKQMNQTADVFHQARQLKHDGSTNVEQFCSYCTLNLIDHYFKASLAGV